MPVTFLGLCTLLLLAINQSCKPREGNYNKSAVGVRGDQPQSTKSPGATTLDIASAVEGSTVWDNVGTCPDKNLLKTAETLKSEFTSYIRSNIRALGHADAGVLASTLHWPATAVTVLPLPHCFSQRPFYPA